MADKDANSSDDSEMLRTSALEDFGRLEEDGKRFEYDAKRLE